jgi:hypothetical protein
MAEAPVAANANSGPIPGTADKNGAMRPAMRPTFASLRPMRPRACMNLEPTFMSFRSIFLPTRTMSI